MLIKEKTPQLAEKNSLQIYISYLKEHFKKDFHPLYYGITCLFLVVCISLNYYVNFKKGVIDPYYGSEIRVLWYFLFYSFAYFSIFLLHVFIFKKQELLRSGRFWFLAISGMLVLSFDSGFYYHKEIAYSASIPPDLSYYLRKCLYNLRSLITVFLPLALLYRFYFKKESFFGLSAKNVNLLPYFFMLLVMLPLITWASFQPDFLRQYPTLRPSQVNEYLNVPAWITALIYEICYGWDFVSTELMFRGFLVVGMAQVLGRGAILPMVATYTFLHFGKPLGETIGSVFGGYILGVIALYGRNIWGGIVIHIGVAWLMELTAYLQSFRS